MSTFSSKFNHKLVKAFLRGIVLFVCSLLPYLPETGLRKPRGMDFEISLWLSCSKDFRGLNQLLSQFSSVAQSYPTLCDPMDRSTPGHPVHHQLSEFTHTQVRWVSDDIQPFHPLSSPSPAAFNLSQHQGLFKWVSSLHQVAKVLEFQFQHQSFQWTFRTDLL